MQTSKIQPKTLAGFMELMPSRQIKFDGMISKIQKVFELNSFLPINTPIIEYADVLLAKAGGETEKQIYSFQKGDTDMCLRFDLTVPLAKYVSLYRNELSFPFKRYQIGKCFRGERPQKGRFREFVQCDIDIIGDEELPIIYDAECIAVIYEVYHALGLDSICVKISNRKILNGLIEHLKLDSYANSILTIIDKMCKIGKDNVAKMLEDLGIEKTKVEEILSVISFSGTTKEVIALLKTCGISNQNFLDGIKDLEMVDLALKAQNIPQSAYQFDIKTVRGLDYYTGTVFETVVVGHEDFGSVAGGGRYDNLTEFYCEKKMPGVGVSIGATRLFDLLDKNGLLGEDVETTAKCAIIPLGDTLMQGLSIGNELRTQNISVDVNVSNKSFKAKLNQANKMGVPYVIIIGEDEVRDKSYVLKNMKSGIQAKLTINEIIEQLK